MITIETNKNILFTKVENKITEADFEKLKVAFEKMFGKFGKVRWYYEMENFVGWEIKTFFEDSAWSLSHRNDIEKIAMLGEKKWQEIMTELMKPFTSAEIRYFPHVQKSEAEKWIEE
ncbi:MAG: STAS/SEC14 domain-containing protein [Ginsengibacter sp.]